MEEDSVKSTQRQSGILPSLPTFPQDAPLTWAAVCGAVSAIGLRWDWAVLGRLLAAVVFLELVCRWAAWLVSLGDFHLGSASKSSASATLPYTLPDSPAQRAADWASGAARAWNRFWTRPSGLWARTLALLLITGLLLCSGIGAPGMWIGLLGLAAAVLCGLWLRRWPVAADIGAPAVFIALAWVLGALAVGGDWSLGLAAAPVFGLAGSGMAALRNGKSWGKGLLWAGLTAPAVILIAHRLALPAVAVLFVAAPAHVISAGGAESHERFARAIHPLLLLSMAVVALSLGW
jgi:hypothetical protein